MPRDSYFARPVVPCSRSDARDWVWRLHWGLHVALLPRSHEMRHATAHGEDTPRPSRVWARVR
jgi:hypothetical protein